MEPVNFKAINNEIFLTRNKGDLSLSFLAHLQNAIAHGNAMEHN